MSARLAVCATPKPTPNSSAPAITAIGWAVSTNPSIPTAATSTAGARRRTAPYRSTYRPDHQRESVRAAALTNSAAGATLPDGSSSASGRNVTTTPAAIVVEAKTKAGRSNAGVRSPVSTPSGRVATRRRLGSPSTAGRTSNAASPAAVNTSG
jgi:hypothetical protein